MALFTRQFAPMPEITPEYLSYTLAPTILAITGSFTGVAVAVFLARVYVRTVMLKVFGPDDWIMSVAVAFMIACFGALVEASHHGFGKHLFAIDPKGMNKYFYALWWDGILAVSAISLVKISVAFFLLRLAQRTQYRRFLYGSIVFLTIFMVIGVAPIIFRCAPIHASWDIELQPPTGTAKCMELKPWLKWGVVNSCVNIVTDVLFAVLPIPMIWTLQVNLRTKISLIAILSLGFFACAAAIYKTPIQANFASDPDPTGHGSWFQGWQLIELALGVTAASLPALKPLFTWFLQTARALTTNSRSRTNANGSRRPSSLNYFKKGTGIELQSVGDTDTDKDIKSTGKGMYSVKVTGDGGWDEEKGEHSQERILPLQGAGSSGIHVTTQVRMS